MTVDPLYIPIISLSAAPGLTIATGDPLTLSASVVNAGPSPTYQWVVNSTIIPGATTNSYTSAAYADMDSVTCLVTGSGVCSIISYNSVYITVWAVGVNDIATGGGIRIFPNPNNGGFTVKGSIGTISGTETTITIANMLGQTIYTAKTTTGDEGAVNTAVQLPGALANGVYMLSLHAGNENRIFRFVVDK
jgi:hypothetical protein